MSKPELERFAENVRSDRELQGELKKAATSNEAILEFARTKCYDFTMDEMADYIETKKAALGEADLDKIAGGKGSSAEHTQVRAQYLVFSVQEATVFTTVGTMLEVEVVLVAT